MHREGEGGIEATLWLKSIPSKISIFLWREKLARLPTRSVLDKVGVDLDSVLCPRCTNEVVDHVIVRCGKVKTLWILIGR